MNRKEIAYNIRVSAAELARSREHPVHKANGDEQRYASANYAMSFTKGLQHDPETGLVEKPEHFEAFRKAIDEGEITAFQDGSVPVAVGLVELDGLGESNGMLKTLPSDFADANPSTETARLIAQGWTFAGGAKERQWEAPTAGVTSDLEGPDAQAVTMPPAPALGSDELAYEMAEVYELALLRDVSFNEFEVGKSGLAASLARLNALKYSDASFPGRPRKSTRINGGVKITPQEAFRGSSPGVEDGPYLSQFLLIGNTDQSGLNTVGDGRIRYGALQIDQQVPIAKRVDYMKTWADWLAVQNGADTRKNGDLFERPDTAAPGKALRRFISTPRDLATYVHDDALYEAYLNACLILLGMGAPFDPAFDHLSGKGKQASGTNWEAAGFALYGGPHILTLVTEVATRALKAVRYQKFNNHIRLRPEALAARIQKSSLIDNTFFMNSTPFGDLETAVGATVGAVNTEFGSKLLPMAFQEGSPMHPSYGAGHACVAGACVTILKAFFDTSAVLVESGGDIAFKKFAMGDSGVEFRVDAADPQKLDMTSQTKPLTLEGELNKLAANISIGRNMAGVHYFSDYYDSVRMGEKIAIGLLEEQALCYTTDPFVLSVPTFDGDVVRIGRR